MYHIKSDKRAVQSSQLIYSALKELMMVQPYDTITVTALAKRAGVGRATFYRAFDCVDDVFWLECDRCVEELTHRLQQQQYDHHNKTTADTLRTSLRLFLQFWHDHSEIVELLMQANRLNMLIQTFQKMFENPLLPPVFKQIEVPPEIEPYLWAMHSGTIIGLLTYWFQNGRSLSPDQMADLLTQSAKHFQTLHLSLEEPN